MLFKKNKNRGFSLIELLVTLAISIIIVSSVLIRFEAFDSVVVLKSIAYEIALTIREAQVFAVSATGDTSGDFDTPYGVYFNTSNPQNYIFFEDSNGSQQYESGPDSILETYTMNSKYQITQLCSGPTCTASYLSLVFTRPDFGPSINTNLGGSPTSATITIGMTDNPATTFSVLVGLTGQVTVQTP